ncbi:MULTISPECIES: folate family ECF transporter S component [Lactobacillus]|uniref:Folate family ECF transporter S component n=1 Tax=Lactobacillus xujianguonis TaxID=2495899 RepID=A0A437SWU0_9LACO|nr:MULTISPECIES: folate family ECF transporter S component [Lactobacillus]RVU71391.1 folate family ECF transporter S component [Lactobacillus xujianguonis]RVU76948.1 folate family ECF transporter S component [Lactobacillus xujianguonis]
MNLKKAVNLELRELVLLGVIVAIKIVLSQFSFGPAFVKVGLGFIGSVMLGYLFGPLCGAIGGGISDLVSSAIFGNQGGFFIGFTLTAMAAPFIYGLFFYQKPLKVWRVIVATLLVTIIVNIGMNTLWIHFLYGVNLQAVFLQRLPKEIIVPWIQMLITCIVLQALSRVKIKR